MLDTRLQLKHQTDQHTFHYFNVKQLQALFSIFSCYFQSLCVFAADSRILRKLLKPDDLWLVV